MVKSRNVGKVWLAASAGALSILGAFLFMMPREGLDLAIGVRDPKEAKSSDVGPQPASVAQAPSKRTVVAGATEKQGPHDGANADSYVSVASLAEADQELLAAANEVLASTVLGSIDRAARIKAEDLPVFREIVQDAESAVNTAGKEWLDLAHGLTAESWRTIVAKIEAGDTAGLPLASPENSMRPREPFEAVSSVMYRGSKYVVRVSPGTEPRLAVVGQRHEDADRNRLRDFDTLLRSLFTATGDRK